MSGNKVRLLNKLKECLSQARSRLARNSSNLPKCGVGHCTEAGIADASRFSLSIFGLSKLEGRRECYQKSLLGSGKVFEHGRNLFCSSGTQAPN